MFQDYWPSVEWPQRQKRLLSKYRPRTLLPRFLIKTGWRCSLGLMSVNSMGMKSVTVERWTGILTEILIAILATVWSSPHCVVLPKRPSNVFTPSKQKIETEGASCFLILRNTWLPPPFSLLPEAEILMCEYSNYSSQCFNQVMRSSLRKAFFCLTVWEYSHMMEKTWWQATCHISGDQEVERDVDTQLTFSLHLFWDRVSLWSPGCPGTCSVD